MFCEAGRCNINFSIQAITLQKGEIPRLHAHNFSQQGNSNDIHLHASRLEPIQLHVAIHMNRMLLGVTCWTLHPVDLSPPEIELILAEFPLLERGGKCGDVYCSKL